MILTLIRCLLALALAQTIVACGKSAGGKKLKRKKNNNSTTEQIQQKADEFLYEGFGNHDDPKVTGEDELNAMVKGRIALRFASGSDKIAKGNYGLKSVYYVIQAYKTETNSDDKEENVIDQVVTFGLNLDDLGTKDFATADPILTVSTSDENDSTSDDTTTDDAASDEGDAEEEESEDTEETSDDESDTSTDNFNQPSYILVAKDKYILDSSKGLDETFIGSILQFPQDTVVTEDGSISFDDDSIVEFQGAIQDDLLPRFRAQENSVLANDLLEKMEKSQAAKKVVLIDGRGEEVEGLITVFKVTDYEYRVNFNINYDSPLNIKETISLRFIAEGKLSDADSQLKKLIEAEPTRGVKTSDRRSKSTVPDENRHSTKADGSRKERDGKFGGRRRPRK